MLHRQFPASSNNGTAGAYFLHGLVAGLFPLDCAKEWAFEIIESQDNPPIEIIEVATANSREEVFRTLKSVACNGDAALAGRWLLAHVHNEFVSSRLLLRPALRTAMQVAFATGQPPEVCYTYDALNDELYLAEIGTYGTVADVTQRALAALVSHGVKSSGAT